MIFSEMKKRPIYSAAEIEEMHRKWLLELEDSRIGTTEITSLDKAIYTLEVNAGDIYSVMLDKDVNDQYSPTLQSAFDDTMDILDYLKKLRNPI